jgi:hypothetical protein
MKVLIHAAPARMSVQIRTENGEVLTCADVDRDGEYSPMTLLARDGAVLRRVEVWPTEEHHGLPVLLAGGEVGILEKWQRADESHLVAMVGRVLQPHRPTRGLGAAWPQHALIAAFSCGGRVPGNPLPGNPR